MIGCSGTRPKDLGIRDGVLRPCPSSPNCVSSEAATPAEKRVTPFPAPNGPSDMDRLAELLAAWPRTTVVTRSAGYLHAETTSRLMRFVDDVEFRYDGAAGVIHVRSASRLGRSDLGVNRARVDGLLARWSASTPGTAPPR